MSNKILYADDTELNRNLVSMKLGKLGYNIHTVINGEQCLEHINQSKTRPDILLLDIVMPILDGMETLKKIRKRFTPIELPIIMVTTKDESSQIVEALQAGANDYITKPIDFDVALSRIKTQLQLVELSHQAADAREIKALNSLIVTYNHEINNQLAIAMGNIDIGLRNLPNNKDLQAVKQPLVKIAQVMKSIREVTDGKVEYVNYTENQDMIKISK